MGVHRIAEKFNRLPREIWMERADEIIEILTQMAHDDQCAKEYQKIVTKE